MKLSNTLIMNETVLPSNKKAFTLAEVLITLSILGIVAALTIPSLVNRQSDAAAIVKLKKAVSTYEQVAGVYMVENEETDFDGAASSCATLRNYFKITEDNGVTTANGGCNFTTGDGAYWVFVGGSGNPIVFDSAKKPRLGVVMWAEGGEVNADGANQNNAGEALAPKASDIPTTATYSLSATVTNAAPVRGFYDAIDLLSKTSKEIIDNQNVTTTPQAAMTHATAN